MRERSAYAVKAFLAFFMLLSGVMGGVDVAHAIQAGAAEIEIVPYLKGGTIAWDQLAGEGGHKFVVAGGITASAKLKALGADINLEKWVVAEGMDDDEGIMPEDGYSVFADIKYFIEAGDNLSFYPYAGIGFEEWKRGETPGNWKTLKFANLGAGVGLQHDKGYVRAGVLRPFSVSADGGDDPKPRFGFDAEGGIRFKAFIVGLFFRYEGFEDPDAKATQSGLFVGYRFK